MTSSLERAEQLLDEAMRAPPASRTRTELLAEAAEHADASNDRYLAFDVYFELTTTAFESGAVDRGLSAFSYCLSLCDESPESFYEEDLHWKYKWVLEWVPQFPDVSRETIEGLLADMARRFTRRGLGADAVNKARATLAFAMGDADLRARYEAWGASTRDELSDCEVCDVSFDIEALLVLGERDVALARFEALLAGGRSCAEVPHLTYAAVLPHLAPDDARVAPFHERGLALLRGNDKLVGAMGTHLAFSARLGQAEGLRVFRESIAAAALHPSAGSRLDYLLGAEVLVHHAAQREQSLSLTLPLELGGDGARKIWDPTELEHALARAAAPIIEAFDARNGNDWVSKRAARMRHLKSP